MPTSLRLLILGSKEHPVGSSRGQDPLASGGMEVYTQELARELTAQGLEVTIVTRRFSGQPAWEEHGLLRVARVRWARGFLLRNASFNLLAALRTLRLPHDAVLTNGFVAALLASFLRLLTRKPVLARPAGIAWVQPQYGPLLGALIRSFERLAYKRADVVVFLSEQEREQFERKLGFLPARHRIIPTGVRPSKVSARAASALRKRYSKGLPLVVFTGRLSEVKGLRFLLEAAPRVRARFLLVGEGPLHAELERTIQERNLTNVLLAGERTPEEVKPFLAAADVFVLPSLSEGLPLSLLEAMAAGRACVVTDIGLPVKHGETALVVPPGDSLALASALDRALKDSALRRRLGSRARKEVLANFSWKKAGQAYVQLVRELVPGE